MVDRLQVFPVAAVFDNIKKKWQKKPAIPKGQDWKTYNSEGVGVSSWENFGVVIPTGVIVIDIDTHKGVTTSDVDAVLGCSLDWDNAQVQRTVSGGMHYAFKVGDCELMQGSNLLGCEGFDTRVAGKGWICTGKGYEDLTLYGLPDALGEEDWPMLPDEAITALSVKKEMISGDLDAMINAQPLDDLSLDDAAAYIEALPLDDVNGYDSWLRVGMACYHQFAGGKDGLMLWVNWSKKSKSYDADEIKRKWRSFSRSISNNPVTFASVIQRAGGKGVIAGDVSQALEDEAATVHTKEDYLTFRNKVKVIDSIKLPNDMRGIIATILYDNLKGLGLSKADIKKALTPEKKKREHAGNAPEWLDPWVYVEKTREFINIDVADYSIKKEAFNAKYACHTGFELEPSDMALKIHPVPKVVDVMFWPGADKFFIYEDKEMLNLYHDFGDGYPATLDDEGQRILDGFLKHLKLLVEDEKERRIILDWMAYVVQNPGKRVNWALLLQGCPGNGKSFLIHVLNMVLGSYVRQLSNDAIGGRFTGWAHGALVCAIEEIRIAGSNKYEVTDKMKPFISNPTIQIEEKGRDHRTVPNFTSYFLLTNHKDAVPIDDNDRRYCPIFCRAQSQSELFCMLGGEEAASLYFAKLWDDSRKRPDVYAHFLHTYKVSDEFNADGRAPETKARKRMVNMSKSIDQAQLEDWIDEHHCDVINDEIIDITYLNDLIKMDALEPIQPARLRTILVHMGYENIGARRIKLSRPQKHHYVWTRPNLVSEDDAIAKVRGFHGKMGAI